MKEVNEQTFSMMNILEKHILRLQKEVSELKEIRQPLTNTCRKSEDSNKKPISASAK